MLAHVSRAYVTEAHKCVVYSLSLARCDAEVLMKRSPSSHNTASISCAHSKIGIGTHFTVSIYSKDLIRLSCRTDRNFYYYKYILSQGNGGGEVWSPCVNVKRVFVLKFTDGRH